MSRRTTRRGDGGQAKSRSLTADLPLPCVLHPKTLHSRTLIVLCGNSAYGSIHPFPLLAKAQSWEPLKGEVSSHLPLESSGPASQEHGSNVPIPDLHSSEARAGHRGAHVTVGICNIVQTLSLQHRRQEHRSRLPSSASFAQ